MAVYCCILSNCHQNCLQNSTFQRFLQVGGDGFWWMMPNSLPSTRISLPYNNLAFSLVSCGWKWPPCGWKCPQKYHFLNTWHYTAVFQVICIKMTAQTPLSSVFCRWGDDEWCQIKFYPHEFHFQTLTLPWLPFFVDGRKTLVDRSAWNYNFFKHITWLYTVYCCIRSNCHQNCCQNSTFQCFLQVGGDGFWWMLPYSLLSTQISLPNINLALASGFCAWK